METLFLAQRALRRMLTLLLVWVGLASTSNFAIASTPALAVDAALPVTALAPYLAYRVQSDASGTIADISALPDSAFTAYDRDSISEGFTPDAWWFRFQLANHGTQPVLLHLEPGNPFLDHVELFTPNANGYTRVRTGAGSARASMHAISFEIPAATEATYYLRIMTSTPLIAPVEIASNSAYLQATQHSRWIDGLVYGSLLALLLYNLLLLATVREGLFFSFVLYVCALIGALAGVDGLIHEALPDAGVWPTTLTFMALNLAIGMLALLTCIASGASEASRKCRLIGSSLAAVNVLAMQSFFFMPDAEAIVISLSVAIATLALTTVLAALQIRYASRSIRPHLMASVAFNIAGIAVLLAFIGILPNFPLALAAIKVTVAVKLGLLSLALGQRINELKLAQSHMAHVARNAVDESQASIQLLEKMGHRIRTPLNGVIGLAETLGNSRLDREQRQALSGIQESGESLLNVLNDAMDFSLIEAGSMSLEIGNYDLESVLNDCIRLTSHQAREKQIETVLCIGRDTPTELRGDAARVRQIVMYFLSNALEHADAGSIVINAGRKQDKAGRATTRISVRDTGAGIPADVQADLFNAYAEPDHTSANSRFGSGLGLAISKKLVDMMNGTIGVQSKPGAGSTFWFEIPERKSLMDVFAHKAANAPAERRQAVLIVDAHNEFTGALMDDRVTRNIDLRTAPGIESARHMVLDRDSSGARFDLVLLDEASVLSGTLSPSDQECLQIIRKMTKTALMRSGGEDAERKNRRFTFEVDKPRSGRQLETVVQNVLIGEPAAHLDNWSHDDEARQQLADLKVLVVDDNEVSVMVTCGFLQRMGVQDVDVALDGEEALARFRANRDRYDLVLMDCEMPRMDGYQATRSMREWEASKRLTPTTVIAISAHVSPEVSRKSLDAGMQDHMPKPLQFALLRDKLIALFPAQDRPRKRPDSEAA